MSNTMKNKFGKFLQELFSRGVHASIQKYFLSNWSQPGQLFMLLTTRSAVVDVGKFMKLNGELNNMTNGKIFMVIFFSEFTQTSEINIYLDK